MYSPTTWRDHVTVPANRFNVANNGDGTHTITPAGEVMQQGTPQDQAHFNNIEVGVGDAHTATGIWLQFWLQFKRWVEDVLTGRVSALEADDAPEIKTVTLSNAAKWPFNNSQQTLSFSTNRPTTNYTVDAEIKALSGGTVQAVKVSDRLANGCKVAFEGDATSVTLKIIIKGGITR